MGNYPPEYWIIHANFGCLHKILDNQTARNYPKSHILIDRKKILFKSFAKKLTFPESWSVEGNFQPGQREKIYVNKYFCNFLFVEISLGYHATRKKVGENGAFYFLK